MDDSRINSFESEGDNMSSDIESKFSEKLGRSNEVLERAKKVLLSPVATGPFRAPRAVVFVKEGKGGRIKDLDGNEYVDVTMAYGPLILGHSHPVVVDAVEKLVRRGTVYAIAHENEVRMAEILVEAIPCAERVAFANSGTEATMHAMKVARARTGKDKIAKFEGGYHGVHDYAQVSSLFSVGGGTIEDPLSVPDTRGIPQAAVDQVMVLSYNRPESIEKIRKHKDELAAVIIEPVPSALPIDMGDFLRQLRKVTRECGVLLIFDEVISGFRLAYGGAQEYFGVVPDMATYGKIIGGGFPIGAIAGSVDALQPLVTTGDFFQDIQEKCAIIGTFSGNPISTGVGAAVLKYLGDHPEIYDYINSRAARIKREVQEFCKDNEFPLQLFGLGSWFVPHFHWGKAENPRDLLSPEGWAKGTALGHYMRYNKVYMPDLHTVFVSAAHTDEDIELIIEGFKKSLMAMKRDGILE
ncbi:MAG: aspartate aminotransferase family protein [Candidatus Abyssobacteria bacterium SURF_5]|uniref:Aspartate aminotransferase family protein n=1 Tax=Abyssobacteria bacterium (strain SURF_5) TaxID=2093360 RepID=A0A3A4NGR3_ABYX5|nr:MAG: aspartate aminotransferase family protein [Candidatus Abyssubacteria bacterium SURF_5]